MTGIVAADIGGTHARFALATVAARRVTALGPAVMLRTAGYGDLATAWTEFAVDVVASAWSRVTSR